MGVEFQVCADGYRIGHGDWSSGRWRPTTFTGSQGGRGGECERLSDPRPGLGWTEGFVIAANSERLVPGGSLADLRAYFGPVRISDADLLEAVSRFGLPFGGRYSYSTLTGGLPVNSLGEIRYQVHLYQRTAWLVGSLMRGEQALLRRLVFRSNKYRLPLLPRLAKPAEQCGVLVYPDRYAADFGIEVPDNTEDAIWQLIVETINSQLPLFAASPRLEYRPHVDPSQRVHFIDRGTSFLEVLWLELVRKIASVSPLLCGCGDRIWARSSAKAGCARCTQRRYDSSESGKRRSKQAGQRRRVG